MPTAEAVARYFLHLAAASSEPTPITQMQLHKLLYYAQGWCLATRGRSLFDARIQAWTHGPVIVEMYPCFADFGSSPIPASHASDKGLDSEDRTLAAWVWDHYGRFTGAHLRRMTHHEPPWKNARGRLPDGARSDAPIEDEAMKAHFESLYRKWCLRAGLNPDRLAEAKSEARRGETTPLSRM